jgi:holo-[acyl-carrier protein] synthase
MIMGIGIDIVFIPRLHDKDTLAKRILSEAEWAQYILRKDKDQFLAGRFAAKEAYFKARHQGLGNIPMRDVSILNEPSGAPVLSHDGKTYPVSISHDGDYAIAIVHIEE